MSPQYDAIIVGAGHNGLVCANALAEKGKRVLMLEANQQVGGMAITREFATGYKASVVSHLLYGLHPRAQQYAPALYARHDNGVGDYLKPLSSIVTNSQGEYLKLSESTQWSEFCQEMKGFSSVLYQLSDQVPPRLKETGLNDIKALLGAGWQARKLKREGIRKFLRIVGMNIYDLADESLGEDLLKVALCFEAIIGTRLGPRAPNTVYNWLNRRAIIDQQANGVCGIKGGLGALSEALAQHAIKQGVEIRTGTLVGKILVEDNTARAVQLADGEQIAAKMVISNADIKTTMLDLVGPQILETQVVRKVHHIPMQGSTAKMHIALDKLPTSFTGDQRDLSARIICADSANTIERASNGIKYGEFSPELPFEVNIPSIDDPALAPADKHVMSVLIPYVPYENRIGWSKQKTKFKNQMMSKLDQLLPGIKAATSKVEVLLPSDIEAQCKVTGGHWHHGEIGLERFMMLRPSSGFGQYQTVVKGLYLCGADCHPGGDVNGATGLNAARAILRRAQI